MTSAQPASPATETLPQSSVAPPDIDPSCNVAVVIGRLTADPVLRELASGTVVADLSVTTSAPRGPSPGVSTAKVSVPVAWHNPGKVVHRLQADQTVLVVGHVARRFFRSGGQLASRTEVVALSVLPITQKAACRKALTRVTSQLADLGEPVAA